MTILLANESRKSAYDLAPEKNGNRSLNHSRSTESKSQESGRVHFLLILNRRLWSSENCIVETNPSQHNVTQWLELNFDWLILRVDSDNLASTKFVGSVPKGEVLETNCVGILLACTQALLLNGALFKIRNLVTSRPLIFDCASFNRRVTVQISNQLSVRIVSILHLIVTLRASDYNSHSDFAESKNPWPEKLEPVNLGTHVTLKEENEH